MSLVVRPGDEMDDLVRLFYDAQSRAEAGSVPAFASRDSDHAITYAEMVEEAIAIEAAWLAKRDAERQAEAEREYREMVEEAIAIEAAWLASRQLPEELVTPAEAPVAAAVAETPAAESAAPEVPATPQAMSSDPPGGGRHRWLRRGWTFASWAGVSLVAVLVVMIAAAIVIPRAMGWTGMVVLSGSMEPTLSVGGLAFMDPVGNDNPVEAIEAGDIITFRVEGVSSYISHRVVAVISDENGLAFVTKGDANDVADADPIAAERVVGVVRFDLPLLGRVVERLQDRSTYYFFVGIPAALLILTELISVGREVSTYYRDRRNQLEVNS